MPTTTSWAYEDLLTTTDVPLLQNGGKLPVMLSMTCYDGYYHYPYPIANGMEALGEVMTRADGNGAVASWSPTGVGVATGHDSLDQGFFQSMFLDGLRRLGGGHHRRQAQTLGHREQPRPARYLPAVRRPGHQAAPAADLARRVSAVDRGFLQRASNPYRGRFLPRCHG